MIPKKSQWTMGLSFILPIFDGNRRPLSEIWKKTPVLLMVQGFTLGGCLGFLNHQQKHSLKLTVVEILKVGRGAFPDGAKRLFLIQGEIFHMIFGAFFLAEYLLRLVQVDLRNWKSDHLTSSTIEEIFNPNQKFERPMPPPQCVGVFFSSFFFHTFLPP